MERQTNLTVNGVAVRVSPGTTILDAARQIGVEIPTLCFMDDCPPVGACRVCAVEVEGSRTLVGSCHTPAADGMVVRTDTPRVIETRRVLVELMLASHPDSCIVCDKANICELRRLATDLDIGLPRFHARRHYYPIETDNPSIVRDMTKCILCRRCVSVCASVKGTRLFSVAYRGFESKVIHGADEPLPDKLCADCDACVSVCPTGALSKPVVPEGKKQGRVLFIKG